MPSNSKNIYCRNTNSPYILAVSWSEASYSVNGNTSTISAYGSIGASNVGWNSNYNSYLELYWHDNNKNTDVLIKKSSGFLACGYQQGGTRSVSGTINVTHKDDGSLSGYVICKFIAGSDSGGWSPSSNNIDTPWSSLTTIPRKADVVVTGDYIGDDFNKVQVQVKKPNDSFTCSVDYSFEGSSWTNVAIKSTQTTFSFVPPISLCSKIPNSATGILQVKVSTYSGSTLIGESITPKTLSVPSSVKPSLPDITLTRIDNSVPYSIGEYVQNISQVKVDASSTGSYGSTIKTYSINGLSGNGLTLGPFTSGTQKIQVTATDSRGITNTNVASIIVYEYNKPSVKVTASRCDLNGVLKPSGTQIKVNVDWTVSSVNGKNYVVTKNATCNGESKTSFNDNEPFILRANLNVGVTSEVNVVITDALGNEAKGSAPIGTDVRIMNIKANKKGIAFGKFATIDECVDFGWKAKFSGGTEGVKWNEVNDRPLTWSWNNISEKPSTFPPNIHIHDIPEPVSVAGWDEAWKFPSGLMILRYWTFFGTSANDSAWMQWGSGYYCPVVEISSKNIPAGTFITQPTFILGSAGYGNAMANNQYMFSQTAGGSVTKTPNCNLERNTRPGSNDHFSVCLTVIGRWK